MFFPQGKEEGEGDGQMVKLSKLKKVEDEGEKREMITPALREALTKQGEEELGCRLAVTYNSLSYAASDSSVYV